MIATTISIENLKCGGCGNSIKTGLKNLEGVEQVAIDFDLGEVAVSHSATVERGQIAAALKRMGYPEKGTVEGLASLAASAKSFVSCAVGRMSDAVD